MSLYEQQLEEQNQKLQRRLAIAEQKLAEYINTNKKVVIIFTKPTDSQVGKVMQDANVIYVEKGSPNKFSLIATKGSKGLELVEESVLSIEQIRGYLYGN